MKVNFLADLDFYILLFFMDKVFSVSPKTGRGNLQDRSHCHYLVTVAFKMVYCDNVAVFLSVVSNLEWKSIFFHRREK